ncbi:hypothetical protein FQN54_003697 [Arachnomyces sp. PD_36]|nr:hypothetical protein FQN54_003697 [Arachnomyces sp. PD_36]
MTTLVHDKKPITDSTRWDNIILKTGDPFESSSWSNPVHFNFTGYDPSPFWHEDGTVFVTGAHPWQTLPGIFQTTIDLETGEVGEDPIKIWNGTGGLAPEGPHIYQRDGYYYLLIAEGGTGVDHMVTIARSRDINGPYESNPANPVLTNANTTEYFQTVGHADIFQDASENWWSVALSTRSGPDYVTYPMGRETVLTPVTWDEGEWPVFSPVRGEMVGPLPAKDSSVPGKDLAALEQQLMHFAPESSIPDHFIHWRLPTESYTISEPGHPYTLALKPSKLNLTAHDGNYAPTGQTFVGVRQTDTLFNFRTNIEFSPSVEEEEAGVSVFLTMNHHIDLGIVMLPTKDRENEMPILAPHFRFRAESSLPITEPVVQQLPRSWWGKKLCLEIKTVNSTHYAFSAGLAQGQSEMLTVGYGAASLVSWGFTGTLVGAYSTSNGEEGSTKAYLSDWKYTGEGQVRG